ncbi:MAG: response regulator [bacterium]
MNNRIVLAIGEDYARSSLKSILQEMNLNIHEVRSGPQAIKDVVTLYPELVFIDDTLPYINGYQFSRLLKSKLLLDIPLILFCTSQLKMDRFWGASCGADYCLSMPVNIQKLKEIIKEILAKKRVRKSFFTSSIIGPHTSDIDILKIVNDLLDRDLFQQKLFNDLSAMNRQVTPLPDLISVMMSIVGSLFPFQSAAFFLYTETLCECMVFLNQEVKQRQLDTLYEALITHINKERRLYLSIDDMRVTLLNSPSSDMKYKGGETGDQDISVFSGENVRTMCSYIAFEGLHMENFPKEEVGIFELFLRKIMETVEEKIIFEKSIPCSIIDAGKSVGSQYSFFLSLLGRNMEQARTHNTALTLAVIDVANYSDIVATLGTSEKFRVHRNMCTSILYTLRKIDIVAQIDENRFIIVFPQAEEKEAQSVYTQVKLSLEALSPSAVPLQIRECFYQYNASHASDAEGFLQAACSQLDTSHIKVPHAHNVSESTLQEPSHEELPVDDVTPVEESLYMEVPHAHNVSESTLQEPSHEELPVDDVAPVEESLYMEVPHAHNISESTLQELSQEELPVDESLDDEFSINDDDDDDDEYFIEHTQYEEPSIDEFLENPIVTEDQFLSEEVSQNE